MWGWYMAGFLYAIGALLAALSLDEDDPRDVVDFLWCVAWPLTGILAIIILRKSEDP